jgi:ATP synthase protein I
MMVANYAWIVRRSAAVAAVAAVIMAVLSATLGGTKGLIGAAIGVVVVALFFGTSVVVVGHFAKVSPQAMMGAAVGTYLAKILILIVIFGSLQDTTAFNPRAFGLTVLVCVLVYSAAQVGWSMKLKMLYVEPDGER